MATITNYPTRATVYPLKELFRAPDFDPVTASHQYDDGGMSFNKSDDTGIYTWELEYDGLTVLQAYNLDYHNFLAQGETNDFTFTDRDSTDWTGVRYKSYEQDHSKTWSQKRKVVLCKYPG